MPKPDEATLTRPHAGAGQGCQACSGEAAGGETMPSPASRVARVLLKAPIHLYRYTLKAWFGWHCRHLPTCSEYGLDAIDRNGAWRGFWLTLSRLARCHPWGTSGYDPVPDFTTSTHTFAPWRYGRWTGAHLAQLRSLHRSDPEESEPPSETP